MSDAFFIKNLLKKMPYFAEQQAEEQKKMMMMMKSGGCGCGTKHQQQHTNNNNNNHLPPLSSSRFDHDLWDSFVQEESSFSGVEFQGDNMLTVVPSVFITLPVSSKPNEQPISGGRTKLNGKEVDWFIAGDSFASPWFRYGVGVADGWLGVNSFTQCLSLSSSPSGRHLSFSSPHIIPILKEHEDWQLHRAMEKLVSQHVIQSLPDETR